MSILANLLGGSIAKPIEAIGNILDDLFDSDEEILTKKIILERLALKPTMAQVELNKVEAAHRSLFVAGWRPAIGWVCCLGLLYSFLLQPILVAVGVNAPVLNSTELHSLVIGMLGFGGFRTFEKIKGKTA